MIDAQKFSISNVSCREHTKNGGNKLLRIICPPSLLLPLTQKSIHARHELIIRGELGENSQLSQFIFVCEQNSVDLGPSAQQQRAQFKLKSFSGEYWDKASSSVILKGLKLLFWWRQGRSVFLFFLRGGV